MSKNEKHYYPEYQKAWRARNKEKIKIYMKEYAQNYFRNPKNVERHNLRSNQRTIRLKTYFCDLLGNKCLKCGLIVDLSLNLCVFEFHHVNPSKTKQIESEWRIHPQKFEQLIKEGEIELLCSNCHKIVTWKEKGKVV
jgi:hypothetical protein